MLLSISTEHQLVFNNSYFKQTNPQELDAPKIQTLKHYRLYHHTSARSARLSEHKNDEVNWTSDHMMIKSTNKLQVRWRISKDKMTIRKLAINTSKIKRVKDNLLASLNHRLAEISTGTVEEKQNVFKSFVYKVS